MLVVGVLLSCMGAIPGFAAITMTMQTAGGVTIAGSRPSFSAAFGSVNGLGVGPAAAGVTILPMAGGVLYATPYAFDLGLSGNQTAAVTAYVSANFANSNVAAYSCPVAGACSTSAGYSALALSAASPTTVASSAGAGSSTAYLAVWVKDYDGAGAFNGASSATVTFNAVRGGQSDTVTLQLSATGESAVSLELQSAPGGLAVNMGADFALNFGFVNGIGAGVPSAGLSTVSVPGGTVYVTPYQLNPTFSNLLTSTGSLSVRLTMNFAHPAALALQDAASAAGPFTSIPSSSALSLASGATDGQQVTRYLGLLVNQVNGASAYSGADSATLTYTLTVP